MEPNSDFITVSPFPNSLSAETLNALVRTDQFRQRWIEYMERVTPEESTERRNRNLRRHAIETGIIERLYDLDWGVTEELVAEGLTLDVAEREGEISEETLATINAQLNGLNLLISYIKEKRPFSTSFVKELHASITATQQTYEGKDQFGNIVQVPLAKGTWKLTDNRVIRRDGSTLEYTPAIFVQDEMDKIVSEYLSCINSDIHPLALAAWLHHRFIIVHPFSDGNGRVARALTLLVLIQKDYAPIVVRRDNREEYIEALDLANEGDLEPLIRFFARLEEYALIAELESTQTVKAVSAVQVVNEYAKRLKAQLEFSDNERKIGIQILAETLLERTIGSLETTAEELRKPLQEIDSSTSSWLKSSTPPNPESHYWRSEIIRAAREVDFYANIAGGTWWVTLNLRLLSTNFRFGYVLQKVGHGETGILALTFFAESFSARQSKFEEDSQVAHEPLIRLKSSDAVTFLHSDNIDDAEKRSSEALDKALTAAVSSFFEKANLG